MSGAGPRRAAAALVVAFATGFGTEGAAGCARTIVAEVATDMLYMSASDWRAVDPNRKLALSAGFMRIFCTDQRMSPEFLATCLDADESRAPVFERALKCAAASPPDSGQRAFEFPRR